MEPLKIRTSESNLQWQLLVVRASAAVIFITLSASLVKGE
jgi:hypothetical protein